jgi:hypothetical protein
MSIDSVFHHVSNAGMAVYGQTLLRLKDRGFKLIDVNYVSGPFARFGEEWVPQWKFEELMAQMRRESPSVSDDRPAPALPAAVAGMLPITRTFEKLVGKFRNPYTRAATTTATATPTTPANTTTAAADSADDAEPNNRAA